MGEEIIVHAICHRHIFISARVEWISQILNLPKKAYYCGYTYKQNGNLRHSTDFPEGYLCVTNRVLLIRVKFHERENEVFVELQHLKHPVKNWTASTRINKNRREIAWQ